LRGLGLRRAADIDPVEAGDRHLLHMLDGRRQVVAQAGPFRARIGAEGDDHRLLVGLHDIEARERPKPERRADDGRDHARAHALARPAEQAAEPAAQAIEGGVEFGAGARTAARTFGALRTARPAAGAASRLLAPLVVRRRRAPGARIGIVVPGHQAGRDLVKRHSRRTQSGL
jgi:hypothetical protein